MIEIIALAAFILSITAFVRGRNAVARLDAEIKALKADVSRLEAMRPQAAEASAPAETLPSDATVESESESVQPVAEVPMRPIRELTEIEKGDLIFGGAPMGQDAVEKASRGEPVPAAAKTTAIDAVVPRKKESLESTLGARWAVWVGGIALALGGVFMVKYSIDAGLLSPAVRLTLAALFGLALAAVGEVVRRRALPLVAGNFQNAMIPGVLTAAAAVTLFGVFYAAYGVYGFIGPAAAFALLALVSLATVALSLLHGQGLAGLGLLASLLTPALVSSQEPNAWALFGFLAVAWGATLLASRLRRWTVAPSIGNVGVALWALLYIFAARPFDTLPILFIMLVMIAGVAVLWPGGAHALPVEEDAAKAKMAPNPGQWERLLTPPFAAITVTLSLANLVVSLAMISRLAAPAGNPVYGFLVLVTALAAFGAWRNHAVYAAILAAIGAVLGMLSITAFSDLTAMIDPSMAAEAGRFVPDGRTAMLASLALFAVFILLSAFANHRHLERLPTLAAIWALIGAAVPSVLVATSWIMTGNLVFDPTHGAVAAIAALVLLGIAEWLSRRTVENGTIDLPQGFFVTGSLALFVIALHALTGELATTILIAILGGLYVGATRLRRWPVLPWMMVAAAIVVLARIAWEPTIVGAASLSRTPVFNALLAGYGIPALLLVLGAVEMRNWPGVRVRNLLQALASLFALLTIAILVRHAMNGGVLDSNAPTLGEQSIYTLLAIGASGILMTLDMRSPSPVFRYGSMALGVLSMLSILGAHLIGLNPYFTGELLGRIPVLDLLFIGYLLPGLGYAGLAWYARGKRPMPYVTALAVTGAVLVFGWATLAVRRFWQGESIADWKGFLQGETYTYSVVWLLLGVLLLIAGSRFNAKSIRIASAVLVFVAVIKVFLIDMANLEGFLRALSFIGLGAVLIGIGLFYQKILSSAGGGAGQLDDPPAPATESEGDKA